MSTESIPTLAPEHLDEVTGGTAQSSDPNAQITTLLQTIQSSLKDLSSNNNNNGNSLTQLLPFFLLMRGSGGGGGSCGCGMPGCRLCCR